MLICHCKGLSDREIRDTIRSGARSRREIRKQSGAGGRCGGCRSAIRGILAEEHAREDVTFQRLELAAAR
ncbi:MAG: (2Fe-2S)-binding protein [Deltaproteobacteria bacterium]|nr:(2Fe-2S)-binding protein [Deltaproteobacteria bacterium]MBW2394754.1 (2Fe-2S)-binding protein [Deltaproteobacteria bacterium]